MPGGWGREGYDEMRARQPLEKAANHVAQRGKGGPAKGCTRK